MKALPVLLALLSAAPALAVELEGYAEARGEAYGKRHSAVDESAAARGTMLLKGTERSGDVVYAASLRLLSDTTPGTRLSFDPADQDAERSSVSLREAWVRTPLTPMVDLQAGRFALGWGKTDGYSPADAFLPRDLTDPFGDEKLPLWAARVLGQWDEVRVELVASPVTTPWRLPELGSRFAPLPFDVKYLRENDQTPPEGGFYAARLLSQRGDVDFGVWLRGGVLPAPLLRFKVTPDYRGLMPEREWVRENGAGAEVSWLLDSWVVRAEGGAFAAEGGGVEDALIWAVGAERSWDDYTLIATLADNAGKRGDEDSIPYDRALLPLFMAALSGQHEWGDWKATWMAGLRKGDGVAKLEGGYALTDAAKATLGVDYPYGPTEGALGGLRDGRRGWAALKYSW